jgi:hypothetical protein
MIRLFCWAKERDLNPGFLFIRESYPSGTSNAKADSNEAFLLGELLEERVDLNPRGPLTFCYQVQAKLSLLKVTRKHK